MEGWCYRVKYCEKSKHVNQTNKFFLLGWHGTISYLSRGFSFLSESWNCSNEEKRLVAISTVKQDWLSPVYSKIILLMPCPAMISLLVFFKISNMKMIKSDQKRKHRKSSIEIELKLFIFTLIV